MESSVTHRKPIHPMEWVENWKAMNLNGLDLGMKNFRLLKLALE